ncbi:MAG: hypothetical protein MHMPM18_000642 [Marteilia pararefringens]
MICLSLKCKQQISSHKQIPLCFYSECDSSDSRIYLKVVMSRSEEILDQEENIPDIPSYNRSNAPNSAKIYIIGFLSILLILVVKKFGDAQRISFGIDFGSSQSCVSSYFADEKESITLFCSNSVIPKKAINNEREMESINSFDKFCSKNIEDCIMYPKFILSTSPKESSLQDILDIKIGEFTLESAIVEYFKYLKQNSEIYLNDSLLKSRFMSRKINKIVISVPVEYTKSKVEFLKLCAKKSGMEVIRTIVEPTAASLGYGLFSADVKKGNKLDENKEFILQENILVFDFGSGTLDISFTLKDGNMFTTMKNTGIVDFGGSNFTKCLASYLKEKINGLDGLRDDELFEIAEEKKIEACNSKNEIYDLFVDKCDYLYKRINKPLDYLILQTGLDKSQFNYIVMTGGASLMPGSKQFLQNYFGPEVPIFHENPITAVASGNATMASVINDSSPVIFSAQDFTNKIN